MRYTVSRFGDRSYGGGVIRRQEGIPIGGGAFGRIHPSYKDAVFYTCGPSGVIEQVSLSKETEFLRKKLGFKKVPRFGDWCYRGAGLGCPAQRNQQEHCGRHTECACYFVAIWRFVVGIDCAG